MKLFGFLTPKREEKIEISHQSNGETEIHSSFTDLKMDEEQGFLKIKVSQLELELEMKERTTKQLLDNQARYEKLINQQQMELQSLKEVTLNLKEETKQFSSRPTNEDIKQRDAQIQQLALRLKTMGEGQISKEAYEQAKQETAVVEQRLRMMTTAAEQLKLRADQLAIVAVSSSEPTVDVALVKNYTLLRLVYSLRGIENIRLTQLVNEMDEKVLHGGPSFPLEDKVVAHISKDYLNSKWVKSSLLTKTRAGHKLDTLEEVHLLKLELEEEENEYFAARLPIFHEKVKDHPVLIEKIVDESHVLQTMSEVLLSTVPSLDEPNNLNTFKEPSFPIYKESSFRPRDDKSEYTYLQKVLEKLKSLLKPQRKIVFDSTYGADYASAYAEGIIRKHSHETNQQLQAIANSPYLARVDYVSMDGSETIYIGEQGIEGYVVSWKAEAASLYYLRTVGQSIFHKSLGDVMVDYIRQIDIRNGEIVTLHPPLLATSQDFKDEGLVAALSDKRGADMQAIVATLQREQYEMIKLPLTKPIIIQGSAGSGKSAIALHRLSYLLYKYPELSPARVAIVGPNEAFLTHIKKVLPSLGDFGVKQITFLKMASEILALSSSAIKHLPATERDQIRAKGSLELREIVQRITMNKLNDFRIWAKPYAIETMVVQVLPILREMENYADLSLKERQNLYFNFFIKNIQKEVKGQNDRYREWKNLIKSESAEIVSQVVPHLILFQNEFISETITSLGEVWIDNVRMHAESPTTSTKKEMNESRLRFLDAIQNDVQKRMNEHKAESKKYSLQANTHSFIDEAWSKHIKQKMREQREKIILDFIATQPTEVTSVINLDKEPIVKANLEMLHAQLLKDFAKDIVEFYETCKRNTDQSLNKEIVAAIERAYYRQITAALKREFRLDYSFTHQHSGAVFADDFLITSSEQLKLRNYVIRNLKVNPIDCYEAALQVAMEKGILTGEHSQTKDVYYEDLPALLHIDRLLNGVPKDHLLSYLIIDEAQDYMPYEITELHALTQKNRIMLIGDLGQNLNQASTLQDWHVFGKILGEITLLELKATYRSTAQIVEVGNKIIGPFADGKYSLSTETFRDGEPVQLVEFTTETEESRLIETLEQAIFKYHYEQVVVIVPNEEMIEQAQYMIDPYFSVSIQTASEFPVGTKVVITTPDSVKGLEFDAVVIIRFTDYQSNDTDRKLAYVASSRALHRLYMMMEIGKASLLDY